MKVELTSLGHITTVQDYKLSKKIDDFGVVVSIDSDAKFDKDSGYLDLLKETMAGNTEEPAEFTVQCGEDEIIYDGYILHNEGSFNFKACYAEKKLKFKSVIECIKDITINIFDYTAAAIETVQGDLERETYSFAAVSYFGDNSVVITLNQVLGIVGGIPDRSALGFFPEYIILTATPTFDTSNAGIETYIGHNCTIFVTYVGAFSATQLSPDWITLPSGGFFLSIFPEIFWGVPQFNTYSASDEFNVNTYYDEILWESGKYNTYVDTPISNTYPFSEIFEDIFECTDKLLVSNFLNINPDGTAPENTEYEYSLNFLQDLRIAQSYDIIRENEIQDSFGRSGIVKAKNLVLEFNKLFGMLLIYDDIADVIRWEHFTYYQNKGIDTGTQEISYEFSDDVEVNKDQVNIETWLMAQPTVTEGFYKTQIDYQNYQLNSDVNEITVKSELFLTDVFGALNNDLYDNDNYKKLFFILSTDGTSIIGLNNGLSIKNIVTNCHFKNRPLKQGLHDGNATTFLGYSVGLSADVKIFGKVKLFNKINPGNSIKLDKTGKGTWIIDEIELEGETINFKVKK